MKARVSMLAVTLALGVVTAQTVPANQTQDPQPKAAQTDTKTNAKSDMKGNSTAGAPAEMKTMSFKGVLVDMSCASPSPGSATKSQAETGTPAASDQKNSANRTATDSGSNCPVSSTTSAFGMKLEDGRTVKFDLVGNQRAQDAVKNDKGWNKDIGANKPIHAKVNGVLNGDKLIVASIN
jgi:uncharacterized protein involved in copper resistance